MSYSGWSEGDACSDTHSRVYTNRLAQTMIINRVSSKVPAVGQVCLECMGTQMRL